MSLRTWCGETFPLLTKEGLGEVDAERELKQFGVTLGIVFLLLGFLWLWKSRAGVFYWFELSAFFFIFAFLAPRYLRLAHTFWMSIAVLMGWVMARAILTVVFYFVVTPIGIAARLMGKKFVDAGPFDKADSAWRIRKADVRTKEDCEKQY